MSRAPTKEELQLLNECMSAANAAADGAAGILLDHFGNLQQVAEKEQAGLVSEADRESEAFIVDRLRASFPGHRFLGEETGLSARREARTGDSLWIIDPLDGTTNYVHRFPLFCISIGLEIDGELGIGLVDVPILKERFTAVRGQGAFLNGEKIRCSPRSEFREGLFATGFAAGDPARGFGRARSLLRRERDLGRLLGAEPAAVGHGRGRVDRAGSRRRRHELRRRVLDERRSPHRRRRPGHPRGLHGPSPPIESARLNPPAARASPPNGSPVKIADPVVIRS